MTQKYRLGGFALGLIAIAASAWPAQAQQVDMKTEFEGDGAVLSSSELAVVLNATGLAAKTVTALGDASADVGRTLGLSPIPADRVALAVKARGRAPSGEADARALAQFLGVGRVLVVSAAQENNAIRLNVFGLNARTLVSALEARDTDKANLVATVRAVTSEVLATIAVPPAPPPPPAPVPQPVIAPPVVVAPPPPPLVQAPPPPPVVVVAPPPRAPQVSSVGRGAAVFGVTVGAQALSMLLCYALYLEVEDDGRETDYMDWGIGYTLATPLLSAAAGWGVAGARSSYRYNYGSIVLGTYLGAGVAFGLGAAAHYGLGERPSESPLFWPLTHVVLPLILPAVGAAIFHKVGAKPKTDSKAAARSVAYFPPTVGVSRSAAAGSTVSLSLGSLSF